MHPYMYLQTCYDANHGPRCYTNPATVQQQAIKSHVSATVPQYTIHTATVPQQIIIFKSVQQCQNTHSII